MNKRPGDPLSGCFGYWMCRLEREIRSDYNRAFAPLGVTTSEWLILTLLGQGLETPAVLADELNIDRAAVTRTLGPLQSKGLIRTAPHPSDGRSTVLRLTCAGANLLPQLEAAFRVSDESLLNAISKDESDLLLNLLRRIAVRGPRTLQVVTQASEDRCPNETNS